MCIHILKIYLEEMIRNLYLFMYIEKKKYILYYQY